MTRLFRLSTKDLKLFLDEKATTYNHSSFIKNDPISIPKKFDRLQDIEIIGLWTAILSWGQRSTIINNGNRLIELMDSSPYDFIRDHNESDRKRFLKFIHRTFQPTDALYFLHFFQNYYQQHYSLEEAFFPYDHGNSSIESALIKFRKVFFNSEYTPKRTKKHIATPEKNSSCKRLNMFLRWMVRDDGIVDFGLWKKIDKKHLMIPLDLHVQRVATSLGLLTRKVSDWKAVVELTEKLKVFDSSDPVKYDFALFGLGILQYDNFKTDNYSVR